MGGYTYLLGVPNFANYEATASLIRIPKDGGAIDYISIAEERLARVKHTYAFPLRGIHQALQAFGLERLDQVDRIYTDHARLPRWINSGPGYRKLEHDYIKLRLNFPVERIRVLDHHDAHAASAFYPSPFEEAAVLVVDSLGSRLNTQTLYRFEGRHASVIERGNHWGIGRLYSLVTGSVLPYGPEKGFGKTMGLAPYGRVHPGPVLEFGARDEGMTSDYSAFSTRAPLPRIVAPGVRRCADREQVLDPYFARAAYDVQQECERQMLRMARYAYERTGSRNLCIAGGVALNGLANARVLTESPFEHVWVPPGCSDTGLALGLALWGYFQDMGKDSRASVRVSMTTAYTGRDYDRGDIAALLDAHRIPYRAAEPEEVAPLIADGQVVAWFDGASEFGPRALGHRSIVADPRREDAKDLLNRHVKFREGYRPYAPSILAEEASNWLELDAPSPFMLLVVPVREEKRALVPAITHVDGTTRPQTVTPDANPAYYRLIREFFRLTGVPMVINTSMNVNREPIVETPIDALLCAFGTRIDALYLSGWLIDCRACPRAELVAALTAERATRLDEEWTTVTSRYLTRYDTEERDAYLAEENAIAEWHRRYRAKSQLEERMVGWRERHARVLIVGTRAHTRCLYERIPGFADLRVAAFVALDEMPGERGRFTVYPERALADVVWSEVDAVLISTHEYQEMATALVRSHALSFDEIVTLYDDAADTLLEALRSWPVLAPVPHEVSVGDVDEAFDFDLHAEASALAHRHALIVSYHYCHPPDGPLKGTKSITPEAFDRQLEVLKQNFAFSTMGALMDPTSRLPEAVCVVTFDDGFKDVAEFALPLLRKHGIPATVYCCSAPFIEHRILNVHRVHLLQARLGTARFRSEFQRAVQEHPGLHIESADHVELANIYPYDDDATRRFKRLLNFEVPYPALDTLLADLFQRFVGNERELLEMLYLSTDDLRRCLDAGIEIGIHCHSHLTMSRLNRDEQDRELRLAADYFTSEFGIPELHCSYPYGAIGTWNDATKAIMAERGFVSGVTKHRAIAKPADLRGRWEIPRYDVRDIFDDANELVADGLEALFTAD